MVFEKIVIAVLMMFLCTLIHALFMVAGTHALEWRLTRYGLDVDAGILSTKGIVGFMLVLWGAILIWAKVTLQRKYAKIAASTTTGDNNDDGPEQGDEDVSPV